MTKDTEPAVFVIESLTQEDVNLERKEGDLIKRILNMGAQRCEYRYAETRDEFNRALDEFSLSSYRYLHLSSHGNSTHFQFQFGLMSFMEFATIVRDKLNNKRLFISACEAVNANLANRVIPSSNVYSIIGSYEPINFDDAAIIWSSYYYLAFKHLKNGKVMDRKLVLRTLQQLTSLYGLNINYFSRSRKYGVKLTQFNKGKKVEHRSVYPQKAKK